MMVYYAHPIDQTPDVLRKGHRAIIWDLSPSFDWVYDPAGAFASQEATFDTRVQDINDLALIEADAVFAILPPNVPTVGAVREILKAAELGKPTLVYCLTRPIGLGRVPECVDFWMADERPGQRHDDVRDAARSLAARAEAYRAQPIFLPATEDDGEATERQPFDVLVHGGPEINQLCYSGPLMAERKYEGDAAWDVPALETVTLRAGERKRVKTGVFIAPPPNVWVSMVGRSSMFAKGLFVEPGVIDSGWRGELEAKVYNLSGGQVTILASERIAQLIPHRVTAQLLSTVDVGRPQDLPYGDRGTNGWGSTGS